MQLCIINESHNYAQVKNGQKLVFFKYSRVIYGWKAYGEVNTDFVKKSSNFSFLVPKWPKMAKKDRKWVKMGFLQIQSCHIWLESLWGGDYKFCKKKFNIFIFGPKMVKNGPKMDQKWSKIGFLQIKLYHIPSENLWRGEYNLCKDQSNFSFLVPKWPKMDQKGLKWAKNGFSSSIIVLYIVGMLLVTANGFSDLLHGVKVS